MSSEELTEVIIAYEPVWAIGTGNIALPDDVEKAVKTIRDQIKQLYGEKASKEIQVLYGGSIQPSSAADYANISGVDGLLVGGASLSLDKFSQIVEKVYETTK